MGALSRSLSFAQYFSTPAGVDIWPQQNLLKVLIWAKSYMTWALTVGCRAKSSITIGFSFSHFFRTIKIVTQVYCRIYVMHNFFCHTIFIVFSSTTTPASLATINRINPITTWKHSIRATKRAYFVHSYLISLEDEVSLYLDILICPCIQRWGKKEYWILTMAFRDRQLTSVANKAHLSWNWLGCSN